MTDYRRARGGAERDRPGPLLTVDELLETPFSPLGTAPEIAGQLRAG